MVNSKGKFFVGYDFENSDKTGRLHNIGISKELEKLGWIVVKPKENQSKISYWLVIIGIILKIRISLMFWMPSYKVVLLLCPFLVITRRKTYLGIRDLWYGNPQPIRSIKGQLFRILGKLIFYIYEIFGNVIWIVISDEMKIALLEKHPFIREQNIIVSSTGTEANITWRVKPEKYKLGYFGTFDLQMDIDTYQMLREKFRMIHFGYNDYGLETNGYLKTNELFSKMMECKFLVVFGVDDPARLNRKVFQYLSSNKPILYYGPKDNVTYRILSQHENVFYNKNESELKDLLNQNVDIVERDISKYYYSTIAKELDDNIRCS